jgi:hypothetical protein
MGAVPAENQLPAGQPTAQEQRRIQPASSRAFQPAGELEYVELEERRERQPLRQRRYLDEEPEETGRRLRPPGRSTDLTADRTYDRSAAGPERIREEDEQPIDRRSGRDYTPPRERDYGREDERDYRRDYDREPISERIDDRDSRSERGGRGERELRERRLVDVEPEVIDDPW